MLDRFNPLRTKQLNELHRITYRGYTIIAYSFGSGTFVGFNVYAPNEAYLKFFLSTKRAKAFVDKHIEMKKKGVYFRLSELDF